MYEGVVDLLKVDVEGCELDALQSVSTNSWNLVQKMVVEVHNVEGRVRVVVELLKSEMGAKFPFVAVRRAKESEYNFLIYAWR